MKGIVWPEERIKAKSGNGTFAWLRTLERPLITALHREMLPYLVAHGSEASTVRVAIGQIIWTINLWSSPARTTTSSGCCTAGRTRSGRCGWARGSVRGTILATRRRPPRDLPLPWPPAQEPEGDPCVLAIAKAAKELIDFASGGSIRPTQVKQN